MVTTAKGGAATRLNLKNPQPNLIGIPAMELLAITSTCTVSFPYHHRRLHNDGAYGDGDVYRGDGDLYRGDGDLYRDGGLYRDGDDDDGGDDVLSFHLRAFPY